MQEAAETPNRLRELREAAGMTQAQLALRIGVTKQSISQWETGETQPSLVKALAVAQALGQPVEALFVPAESSDVQDDSEPSDAPAAHSAPSSRSLAPMPDDRTGTEGPVGKSEEGK